MTTDRLAIAVDPAVRRPLGDITAGAEQFTQARLERIVSLVITLGSAVLGTQAFLNALGSTQEDPRWHLPLMLVVFVPLTLMIAACASGMAIRVTSTVFAFVFPAVLLVWPIVTAGRIADVENEPWIWYLLNVGTSAAVMAFRIPLQLVWAIMVPVLYAVVRIMQVGAGTEAVVSTIRHAVFAMIFAGVVIALAWMLRTVAVGIDRARRDAVHSYATAAAADAAETERVAVAALMHDSVLAALIAAERADTPRAEALAAAMAREALTRLANAEHDSGEGSDEPVPAPSIVAGIEAAAGELGLPLVVAASISPAVDPLPGRVARALVLAATQAIANAVQHAGAQGLTVTMDAAGGVTRVRVADRGAGFDPAMVPDDRLGIRGSIVARMAAAGGRAYVHTAASGTSVTLEWKAPR